MGQFSKKFEDLNFSDNFIFCKVMRNESICKKMLEILLNIKVTKVIYHQTEYSIENLYDTRGIRMDVFLEDSDRIFDIEMQTGDYDDLILRSRYYQSSADVSTTKRHTQYKNLKETFIIFICKDDPFGQGLPVYSKQTKFFQTDAVPYDDKTHNVFYNCSAWSKAETEDVKDVLEFIYRLKANSSFTKTLESFVDDAKTQSKVKDDYMYFQDILEEEKEEARTIGHKEGWEAGLAEGRVAGLAEGRVAGLAEGREEGRAEGREEGREEGRAEGRNNTSLEIAKNLLKEGISVEQISKCTNISIESLKTINIA